MGSPLSELAGSLVVSCQPIPGGPMDRPDIVVAFALAALAGGAKGLRIEGVANVKAVRAATAAPIIGLVKRDLAGVDVRITATLNDVAALIDAGADVIAFDATARARPVAAAQIAAGIRSAGLVAMADVATLSEARDAFAFGADVVGTTLSGYTGGREPDGPDFSLLAATVRLGRPAIAEGRYHAPAQAREAMRLGAFAVVVGTAITRPERVTHWFADAVAEGRDAARPPFRKAER